MKKITLQLGFLFLSTVALAQTGHLMQGAGAVNMSMGGAATAQPLDITGALQWNPAAISTFDRNIIKFDIGLFFSSPELNSTVPEFDAFGQPTGNFFSGTTKDDRGISPMPALAMVWGKADSRHTFGASAIGIAGFGVTFPESTSNPITMPQSMGGFGHIESDYLLLQISGTWAYELNDNFSIGIQPNFNYASLELMPNPTADPTAVGYPSTNTATATGLGAQVGVFFDSQSGFKAGASYKTNQQFSDFEFENTYLDNTPSTNKFKMDYPAILSFGVGYSATDFDFAVDYRLVDYENTDGFSETGWTPTASVAGFGWDNISIISAGVQYKGVDRLPFRVGYTYSTNPISDEVAFFNIPATAIIKNAFQFGFSYLASDRLSLDAVYHYGTSGDKTAGQLLNPMFIGMYPPYGAIPGSEVSYDMTTSMIMAGFSYTLK
ncbi:MAG: outer membrane protein transport protein [Cyclobacteriaceae bacterium]